MKISDLSIRRPVTTLMVFLFLVVLGAVSIGRLNIDLLPKMSFPVAAVITSHEGAGPQEVETMVTKPLEDVIGTVANVKNVTSSSSAGQSMVVAEFNWGTDMDFALLNIREKIDLIEQFLPDGVGQPMVVKFDPSMMPVMTLEVSGIDDLAELKRVADDEIKPRLERLEGVASVGIGGGLVRFIKVDVDQAKLSSYGLTLQSIMQTLQAENLNLPGGSVRSGNLNLLVRTTGEFQNVSQIGDLTIASPTGVMVKLKEVATVADSYDEESSYVLHNGKPAVSLSISKETDANTVNVSRAVNKEMERIRQELPAELEFEAAMDTAEFIQFSIDSLKSNAVMGGLLALAILLFFLRNITSTLIIGVAIPVSVVATFILVYFAGLDLNMMTLGGLALGVGMLVDNSIVVLENIYRYRQQGYSLIDAAREGSSEVGVAIVASTLTTVVVFLPVVFTSGMTSQIFKELALTITFSLLASLFVALTLVPMLSSKFLHLNKKHLFADGDYHEGMAAAAGLKGIMSWYAKLLSWCLEHRKTTIVVTTLVLVGSLTLIPRIGAEFLPNVDSGELSVDILMAKGTVLEDTEKVVQQVDQILTEIPEVGSLITTVGTGLGMDVSDMSSRTDRAAYFVRLVKKSERERSTDQVLEEIRQKVSAIPGAEIRVGSISMFSMGGSGKPINIKIKGPDLDTLRDISDNVVAMVKAVEGTREVESSFDNGRPELEVNIDRDRAGSLGLTAYTIASYVRTAIEGSTATKYKVNGEELDVVVRLDKEDTRDVSSLHQLMIPTPTGMRVPLSEVAQISVIEGPNVISRENQERIVSVSAAISGTDLKSVTDAVQKELDGYPLPARYSISMGGESEEMFNAFKDLALALILAVALVYMILAAQFESLVHPFTIMMAVPLALIGVILGLFLGGQHLSVVAIIGVIMLAGIVVNNSIVLVDYTNILRRKHGLSAVEALLQAGPVRLRPIMMTALTTILALIPLVFSKGEGAELRAPLAVVVIGGLTVATVLTLVVVPVIYASLDAMGTKMRRRFQKGRSAEVTIQG